MQYETLGLMLVNAGLIERVQLYEALRLQGKNGKQLGSCLLELGFIEPDALLEILAKQNQIPYLASGILPRIPSDNLQFIPLATAQYHRIVPFRKNPDGILDIALCNPLTEFALQELAGELKQSIRPFLALENEIVDALKRMERGDNVGGGMSSFFASHTPEKSTAADNEVIADSLSALDPSAFLKNVQNSNIIDPNAQTALEQESNRERMEKIDTQTVDASSLARSITPPRSQDQIQGLKPLSIYNAAEKLYEAYTLKELATTTAQCLLSYFSRVSIFEVQASSLVVTIADGFEKDINNHEPIDLTNKPLLKELIEHGQNHYGHVSGEHEARLQELISAIQVIPPQTYLLVPVKTKTKGLLFLIYADNKDLDELYEDLGDMEILLKELQTAIDVNEDRFQS